MQPNEEFYYGIGMVGAVVITLISWAIVVWGFNSEINPAIFSGTGGIGLYRIWNGVRRKRNGNTRI